MSEMSQAQAPDTGAGGTDPLSGDVSEVAENLDDVDHTGSGSSSSSGGGTSASGSSGSGQSPDSEEEDGLLNADLGGDRNLPSEGGALAEPGDPNSSSDPMPDIAGTGS